MTIAGIYDRVRETCTAPGTGTVTLLGAATGYQAFSAVMTNGGSCLYCIADQSGANWEVGTATWNTGGTLTRTSGNVLASSAGASTLVNFATGTQDVFITLPAETLNTALAAATSAAETFATNADTTVLSTAETYASNASNLTSGTVPAARLPAPTASTLGGIQSAVSVSHNWVAWIGTDGAVHQSQPAFSDISGSVSASQLPNPGASTLGGVKSLATVSHQFVTGIDTSGNPTTAQPAYADISGLGTAAQLTAGAANGVATLDSGGHVPTAQLPASVVGADSYVSAWNANTNSPTLTSGTGTQGNYYIVSVAGTTTLDGISRWEVGDRAIFDGSVWERLQGSPSDVSSWNGRVGAVSPATNDYSFSQISGSVAASQLPAPTASTLGGVESIVSTAHQWIAYIDTSGVPHQSQPAFSDISGTASNAQIPAPTVSALGGIQAASGATSHQWVSYVDTSGVQHFSQPSFSDISGSVAASQLPNPSATTLGGVESITVVAHNFLTGISTSGVPTQAQPAFTDISGTATAAQGGTGQSVYAVGDLLYASTTTALSRLADVATGSVLISGGVGVAPSWGTAPIAGGGTGQITAGAAFDALTVKSSNIASATTTDLSTATGQFVDITGTTTITGLGTMAAGVRRVLRFTGAGLTLTYNATSLILPGAANISVATGDVFEFESLGSGNWVCVDATLASGKALVGSGGSSYTADESTLHLSSTTFSIISTYAGQTSITTLGAVGTGTWQATLIGVTYGGSGANLSATGGTNQFVMQTSAGAAFTVSAVDTTMITNASVSAVAAWATTSVLPNSPTYSNGTSGVGATLTAGSNSTLTVDGGTVALNDLVLVKNQASQLQNGLYKCTTAGSGSAAWVLTRSAAMNLPAQFVNAEINVAGTGTNNLQTAWICSNTSNPTIGTTAITFVSSICGTASQMNTSSATAATITVGYVGPLIVKGNSGNSGGTLVFQVQDHNGANVLSVSDSNDSVVAAGLSSSSSFTWANASYICTAAGDISMYRAAAGIFAIGTGGASGRATLRTGGLQVNAVTKTTTYSALITDYLIIGDTTTAGFTITLPAASTSSGQEIHIIKKVAANTLTIKGNSAEVINMVTAGSSNTQTLTAQYAAMILVCDGTAWWVTSAS